MYVTSRTRVVRCSSQNQWAHLRFPGQMLSPAFQCAAAVPERPPQAQRSFERCYFLRLLPPLAFSKPVGATVSSQETFLSSGRGLGL